MIRQILLLRLKQVFRILREAGWGLSIIGLVMISGLVLQFIERILSFPAYVSIFLIGAAVFVIQKNRQDVMFLASIVPGWFALTRLFFLEYLIFIGPVILYQLFQQNFWIVSGLLLVAGMVAGAHPWIQVPTRPAIKRTSKFIPLDNFELKIMVEKQLAWLIIVYLLAWLGVWHVAFFLVSVVVISLMVLTAFEYFEPREMVHYHPRFLNQKIRINFWLVLKFFLPPFICTLLFHPGYYLLLLYAMLILIVLLILAIVYKYALYSPLHITSHSNIVLSVLFIISLLPGGVIITMAFIVWKYRQALHNLHYYYASVN